MKKLKMKSFRSVVLWMIIPFIIGIVLFPKGITDMIQGFQKPADLADLDYSGDIENLRVKGTVQFVYDYYCESTRDGVLDSREYIIDGGEDYYIGMFVKKKDMFQAEALMEACYAYMESESKDEALAEKIYGKQYEIEGVIRKMPDDSRDLYKEYMDWDSMTEEERAMHLPYYIVVNEKIGVSSIDTWMPLLVGGGAFLLSAYFIIKFFSGGYQKSITNYIQASHNPEAAKEKVEAFLANTQAKNKVLFNGEFICAQSGGTTVFDEIKNLVWIYQSKTTHKRNFITVGVTYDLVLGFLNGKKYNITLDNEKAVQETMEAIMETAPYVVAGYDEDLNRLFEKDMSGFRKLRYDSVMAEQQNGI